MFDPFGDGSELITSVTTSWKAPLGRICSVTWAFASVIFRKLWLIVPDLVERGQPNAQDDLAHQCITASHT
jgi:hypothetical protein